VKLKPIEKQISNRTNRKKIIFRHGRYVYGCYDLFIYFLTDEKTHPIKRRNDAADSNK
jgi:hypothetical protein